jgi:putative transposase
MTRRFKKLAHLLYECKYHVVFYPKYRYKILENEVAKYVVQQIHLLSSQKDGVEVIEINVQPDHVHLVVTIPPKYAVSQYMGFLKGIAEKSRTIDDHAGSHRSGAGPI